MLFSYIAHLRTQSVATRRWLVWWYSSACTLAVVFVWLGVVLLGGGEAYRMPESKFAETDYEAERLTAQERLNAFKAQVGYPVMKTPAENKSSAVSPNQNATALPPDAVDLEEWKKSYFTATSTTSNMQTVEAASDMSTSTVIGTTTPAP